MHPEVSIAAEAPVIAEAIRAAIDARYAEIADASYGMDEERFAAIVTGVVLHYAKSADESEQREIVATLRVTDLILARACSAGVETAWQMFLQRFRTFLYEAATRMAKDEATGRELADGLYAELYGVPNSRGERVSKLDYYMGRGSLEGWLRTVVAQQYVNRYRSQRKEVSLEEQMESGVSFAEQSQAGVATGLPEDVAGKSALNAALRETLQGLQDEERFLLASYYLDRRTLANIGRQLGMHESTISRKLERLTGELRKRVRKRLLGAGIGARRSDELLEELDVRDLNVNVGQHLRQDLRQEELGGAFLKGTQQQVQAGDRSEN